MVEYAYNSVIRLLVVEGDPDLGNELSEGLEQAGYEVSLCATAFDAINLLEMEPDIDGVVLDVKVANRGLGWDVAQAIRSRIPDKPIVYLTDDLMDEYATHGVTGSLILHHSAPRATLVASIIELLWRGRGGRPGQPQPGAAFKEPDVPFDPFAPGEA